MSDKFKNQRTVYAVVRIDEYENVPDEQRITVKEILYDIELAKAEVERLNLLNSGEVRKYFWQSTRLYPAGTSAGSD